MRVRKKQFLLHLRFRRVNTSSESVGSLGETIINDYGDVKIIEFRPRLTNHAKAEKDAENVFVLHLTFTVWCSLEWPRA
jgi:hypothetical protein